MSLDAINLGRTTVPIPNLHKEFHIDKLDLTSSQMSGTPLNVSQAESSAYKVAWAEDSLLINGWSQDGTTYEITGLYQTAGNSEGSNLDWGTATNIPTSINNAKALLRADNIYGPYNLVLHPDQSSQIDAFIGTTAVTYRQWIEQTALQGGLVYETPAITTGTGMLVKAEPTGLFEYVIAEDLTTETMIEDIKEGSGLFGRVYVRGLPVVYDANAICKLTTI
jgi:uncharacterized linocin/CFP29 family protein